MHRSTGIKEVLHPSNYTLLTKSKTINRKQLNVADNLTKTTSVDFQFHFSIMAVFVIEWKN